MRPSCCISWTALEFCWTPVDLVDNTDLFDNIYWGEKTLTVLDKKMY